MTQDDAREYQTALSTILRKHNLGWIVDQANEKIALGKTISRRVQASELVPDVVSGEFRRGRRRMTEFLATEPFDEVERLTIVLDAIEFGLVSPPRMQAAMIESLGIDTQIVTFVAEDPTIPSHAFSLADLEELTIRATGVGSVVQKIRALF